MTSYGFKIAPEGGTPACNLAADLALSCAMIGTAL